MRYSVATLIMALVSAMAVQATPFNSNNEIESRAETSSTDLSKRSQAELEAEVAAADALDKREFTYDDEEEDDRAPVKRWIQDFVERAVTPGEKFAEAE